MMTLEDIDALINSPDVGEMQNERKRAIALGAGLRGQMRNIKGNRIGSNIGRAAYGIGGAVNDYNAAKASPEITAGKNQMYGNLRDAIMIEELRKRRAQALPPMSERDPNDPESVYVP